VAKILIREADAQVRIFLEKLFRREGYEVLAFEEIPEGVDLAITHFGSTPRLVEATRQFCAKLKERGIPYIIYTGAHPEDVRKEEGIASGALLIIRKPESTLVDAVREILIG